LSASSMAYERALANLAGVTSTTIGTVVYAEIR
jgi:hypothetical protein